MSYINFWDLAILLRFGILTLSVAPKVTDGLKNFSTAIQIRLVSPFTTSTVAALNRVFALF